MSKKLDEYTKDELLAYVRQLQKDTKFGLVWNPKQENIVTECETKVPVLHEVTDRAINKAGDDEPTHLLLEGDNYHSLSVLNYTHAGKIDVIYIDPPYNTGNKDFIYNDHYVDKEDPYRHSQWLSFMDNRLRLAKSLLSDTGAVFISIDDNEQAHLKILCDKVFGEPNFIANIPRRTKSAGKTSGVISSNHDYMLVYAKDISKVSASDIPIDDTGYKHKDEFYDERGGYDLSQTLDYDSLSYSGSLDYILNLDGESFVPGGDMDKYNERKQGKFRSNDWAWRWNPELVEFGLKNGFIVIKNGKRGKRIYTKTYYKVSIKKVNGKYAIVENDRTKKHTTIDIVGSEFSNDVAKKELRKVFGQNAEFSYPKPTTLIDYVLSFFAHRDNIVVLDFFAGSGTTGHSVLKLNAKDNGKRQFILGTNNENSIAENITFERINKVINGYSGIEGIPANLRYYKTDFVEVEGLSRLTDDDKLEITKEMGAMIALKENSFEQVEQTSHWQTYENATQVTAIYFREDKTKIDEYIEKLNAQDKPVKLYVFGWGKNAGTEYASEKISVEDIPEPLIEVYKEIAK